MGKYERKKPRKSRRWFIPAVAAAVLLAAALLFWLSRNDPEGTAPEIGPVVTTEEPTGDTEPATTPYETVPVIVYGDAVSFPIPLGDGELTLESLFPLEGFNPDCGNREGGAIAAVLVRNDSDRYLKSAAIWTVLGDGSRITFSVSDLPAGKEMLAFSVDNAELADAYECVAAGAEAVFEETQIPEGIAVSAEGITVTVTNESQAEKKQIDVFCHGAFGTGYFGGVTYVYTIEKLAPGESASIDVTECLLGMVDVARVVVN